MKIKNKYQNSIYEIIHYKKFLKIKFWQFREKNLIKQYYIDLENRVKEIINSFLNNNYKHLN